MIVGIPLTTVLFLIDLGLQNQTDLPCVTLSSGYYSRNAEIGYHQVVHTIFNEIETDIGVVNGVALQCSAKRFAVCTSINIHYQHNK